MSMMDLNQGNFGAALARRGILVIDWWARWCESCRCFGPLFESVAARNPDLTFARVDVDAQSELAGTLGIQSTPSVSVFRDGVLLLHHPGMLPEGALEDVVRHARTLDMDELRRKLAQNCRHQEGRVAAWRA